MMFGFSAHMMAAGEKKASFWLYLFVMAGLLFAARWLIAWLLMRLYEFFIQKSPL